MPEFFREWLTGLAPEQKDEMWAWADEDPHAAWRILQTVGSKNGRPNVHISSKN